MSYLMKEKTKFFIMLIQISKILLNLSSKTYFEVFKKNNALHCLQYTTSHIFHKFTNQNGANQSFSCGYGSI